MSAAPSKTNDSLRLLPSYNGSKNRWIRRLEHLRGRNIVELFSGTAAISMNYADQALLTELDPMVGNVISRYDELLVPETFTREDYYAVRGRDDWWRYAYNLSAMAYSGVFRYSGNGFNVPHKGGALHKPSTSPGTDVMHLRPEYERNLDRWRQLDPTIHLGSYLDISDADIAAVGERPLVILDPPYEGTSTPYNSKNGGFDYDTYWRRARDLAQQFDVIIFDTQANLEGAGYPVHGTRTMILNAARRSGVEAISFVTEGARPTEDFEKNGFAL